MGRGLGLRGGVCTRDWGLRSGNWGFRVSFLRLWSRREDRGMGISGGLEGRGGWREGRWRGWELLKVGFAQAVLQRENFANVAYQFIIFLPNFLVLLLQEISSLYFSPRPPHSATHRLVHRPHMPAMQKENGSVIGQDISWLSRGHAITQSVRLETASYAGNTSPLNSSERYHEKGLGNRCQLLTLRNR